MTEVTNSGAARGTTPSAASLFSRWPLFAVSGALFSAGFLCRSLDVRIGSVPFALWIPFLAVGAVVAIGAAISGRFGDRRVGTAPAFVSGTSGGEDLARPRLGVPGGAEPASGSEDPASSTPESPVPSDPDPAPMTETGQVLAEIEQIQREVAPRRRAGAGTRR